MVEELVRHGVGRGTAERLAREKPEVSRRCLEYLPFAKVKTTKGAWLANAIRDEYGPPEGYLKSGPRAATPAAGKGTAGNGPPSPPAPRDAAIDGRVKDLYGRLEKTQPGAFAAFCAHVAAERTRAERIAARLSERRRQECLATFDTEEYRLTLFARWLATAGRVLAREGPPTAGDAAPDGQTAAVA